jgi:hypothetical protein
VGCLIGALASLAVTLVALEEVSPPQTDGLALELTWAAPSGCPDLASERAEIRRRVGEVAPTIASEPIAAQGEIRAGADGGYRLSLRTRVGATVGERLLSGPDCHELADAAALVLALLINPEASLPEAIVASQPESAPPAPSPPSPPPSEPRPFPLHHRSGFGCGIDAVLASGVLPSLAKGIDARLLYQRGPFAATLQVAGFLPNEKSAPVLPGASAAFYRVESALALCAGTPADRRLGAALCLGGALVMLHGESSGVSAPGQATAYWLEALVAASGHLSLTSATRLRLAADLRGLGDRPDFAILGLGSIYRPAAFNVRGTLGLEVLF